LTKLPSYKSLTAIIILAAFLAQIFSRALIVADYYANTGKYAVNCVNKAKPMMHCNGKCQMMKKLKQEEKKDAENPERKPENKNEIQLSSKSYFAATQTPVTVLFRSYTIVLNSDGHSIDRSFDIFHPPRA